MDMFHNNEELIYALLFGLISVVFSLITIFIYDKFEERLGDEKTPISYAAGIFIGIIFFDALPEVFGVGYNPQISIYILLGFLTFSVIELFLGYHEHKKGIEIGIMDLVSDFIHNFLDGLFLYYAFLIDISFGIIVGIGVLLHELPHEVGDYAILLYSGLSRTKAIILNVVVSLSTVSAILIGSIVSFDPYLLIAFMIGNFIYLAAVDLIPEVSKSSYGRRRIINYIVFLSGILTVYGLGVLVNV